MEERLIAHLEECLAATAAGESIESCLARYPDQAEELASLLQVALALEKVPQPGPSAATSSAAKNQFMAEVEQRRDSAIGGRVGLGARIAAIWSGTLPRLPQTNWMGPVRGLATAALTLALLILIGGGVIYAASGSLPGDPLYGFKLLGEDVRRAVALSDDSRIHLEEAFTAQRRVEVKRLLEIGRPEEVTFGGYLLRQPGEEWLVEDIPVVVGEHTRVQNGSMSYAFVEIHGITQADGTVQALLIETEGNEFIGRIESIGPGSWQVAGLRIQIDGKTFLEDRLQIKDCVEVHARRFTDGTLLALEIERTDGCQGRGESDDDGTATPTLTTTAAPTPSPTRTSTVTPTPTHKSTVTAIPTPEPEEDDDDYEEEDLTPTPQPFPAPTDEPDGDDDGDGDSDEGGGSDGGDGDGEDNGDGDDEGHGEEDESGGSDGDGNPKGDEEEDESGGSDDDGNPEGEEEEDKSGGSDDDKDDEEKPGDGEDNAEASDDSQKGEGGE